MSEIFFPVYKDTFYTTSSPTLDYSVSTDEDGVIFRGRAYKGSASEIAINISKIASDYLENKFTDATSALTGVDNVWIHRNAFKYFYLYDGLGNRLAVYGVLFDFDGDFAGESRILSEPIKPEISASQRIPLSVYNPYPANIDVGTTYFQLLTPSLTFSFTGETKSLIWRTNIPVEVLSVLVDNTGYTVSNLNQNGCDITIGPNQTLSAVTGTASIYSGGTELLDTASLLQPADLGRRYFTIEMISGGTLNYTLHNSSDYGGSLRKNGGEWESMTKGTTVSLPTVAGDIFEFKGWNSPTVSGFTTSPFKFYTSDGRCKTYGNPLSLVYEDDFVGKYDTKIRSAFGGLFCPPYSGETQLNQGLVDASGLQLVASGVTTTAYKSMFEGCTLLETGPAEIKGKLNGGSGCYEYMFKDCTSLTKAPKFAPNTLKNNGCLGMFAGCTSLVDISGINFENTAIKGNDNDVFNEMFAGCTSLVTPLAYLPDFTDATDYYSFYGMYSGCTSLTSCSPFPRGMTTDYQVGFESMYEGCSSLLYAPTVLSYSVGANSYRRMFKDCTSLRNAPDLPAQRVYDRSYESMFENCVSITDGPIVSGVTWKPSSDASLYGEQAFKRMFAGCTSLVNPPQFRKTDVGIETFRETFAGCTSLKRAAAIYIDTGSNPYIVGKYYHPFGSIIDKMGCYGMYSGCTSMEGEYYFPGAAYQMYMWVNSGGCAYMFDQCASLTGAPPFYMTPNYPSGVQLPPYRESFTAMYRGCTSLTEIKPVQIGSSTYHYLCVGGPEMFKGCSNLSKISYRFNHYVDLTPPYSHWLEGVAAEGEFESNDLSNWGSGESGIPDGWTRIPAS